MCTFNPLLTKGVFSCYLLLLFHTFSYSQIDRSSWNFVENPSEILEENKMLGVMPDEFQMVHLDILEFTESLDKGAQEIEIPNVFGEISTYLIYPSEVVSAEVKDLYTIKTFQGFKKGDPSILMACDITPMGFHAVVYEANECFVIEPFSKLGTSEHIIYEKNSLTIDKPDCHVNDKQHNAKGPDAEIGGIRLAPNQKLTYDIALVSAGEYSQQFGGSPYSPTNVLNAMASGLNLIIPIYKRDLGVVFNLVSNTDLVYPDPATDPFDTSDQGALLAASHNACVTELGINNFDVGHLLIWDNLGGLAVINGVCNDAFKGQAFTGISFTLSLFWIDYFAHELGHQCGAKHNFSASECFTSNNGNRFEPGAGSSIMCYSNVCGPAVTIVNFSEPYFHFRSIASIQSYLSITSCASTDNSGNAFDPDAFARADMSIPKMTPFVLIGGAEDLNDPTAAITYSWEQYDGAGNPTVGVPDCTSTDAPMFRFYPPVSDTFRYFPAFQNILDGNNNGVTWEKLPCAPRTMEFSLAVRDNNAFFGRVSNDYMFVTVEDTGPFEVTFPNGSEMLMGNSTQTITWNVNGTDAHAPTVDILFSNDGGNTFSLLANGAINDGAHDVFIPNVTTGLARIIVRSDVTGGFRSKSNFFDISDGNFNIQADLVVPLALLDLDGFYDNGQIVLNWQTTNDVDKNKFIVQRKDTESTWKDIGTVYYSSSEVYKFIDTDPLVGINYYRLKQIDNNASIDYSQTITVQNTEVIDELIIFPNPFESEIHMSNVTRDMAIDIVDISGHILLQKNINQSGKLSLAHLPSGVYFVRYFKNESLKYQKIVKR